VPPARRLLVPLTPRARVLTSLGRGVRDLREYSYAQPGTDTAIADQIDHHLDTCRDWDDSPHE
jgi:hypothetical protein